MKNFKDFEKQAIKLIEMKITTNFNDGLSTKLTIDTEIKTPEDMKKRSIKQAIKLEARRTAQTLFDQAKKSEIRMITPVDGSTLNGIVLDNGITLPLYCDGLTEKKDYTDSMMQVGLYLALIQRYDDYYLKLLRLFIAPKDMPEAYTDIISGDYWRFPVKTEITMSPKLEKKFGILKGEFIIQKKSGGKFLVTQGEKEFRIAKDNLNWFAINEFEGELE